MEKKPEWLSGLVTARATVMAPLLILHIIVLLFGILIFYRSIVIGTAYIFLLWMPVLIYTLWRYEQWAEKAPWLLASEKVALHHTDLYGTNDKLFAEQNSIAREVIGNPAQKQMKMVRSRKSKIEK